MAGGALAYKKMEREWFYEVFQRQYRDIPPGADPL